MVGLLIFATAGCSSEQTRKPAQQVTSSSLDEALRTLNKQENLDALQQLAESPAVQRAAEQVGRGLTTGSLSMAATGEGVPRQAMILSIAVAAFLALAIVGFVAGLWFAAFSIRHRTPVHAD